MPNLRSKVGVRRKLTATTAAAVLAFTAWSVTSTVYADTNMEAAKKWVDEEFQPSTLTKDEQMKEMEWFIKAAEPFKGLDIKVVSETIPTHEYESKVLAKAFTEITGSRDGRTEMVLPTAGASLGSARLAERVVYRGTSATGTIEGGPHAEFEIEGRGAAQTDRHHGRGRARVYSVVCNKHRLRRYEYGGGQEMG